MERRTSPSVTRYYILYYGLLGLFVLMIGWMVGSTFTQPRDRDMIFSFHAHK